MSADAMTSVQWSGKLFIDGAFVDPEKGSVAPVIEKATGRPLGEAGVGSTVDLDKAIDAAGRAQRAWAQAPYDERAGLLRRAAAAIEQRAEEIADWLIRETGCIRGKAEYEIRASLSELHEGAALASHATAEILPSHSPGKTNIIERLPVGVVGAITPWNFPWILGMRVLAPAIALGNAVVLKPSPLTPFTGGLLFAEIFDQVEAPPGVLQVIGGDKDVGEHLVAHPGTHMIHFTGSSQTGKLIASRAGELLKKVSMELGGNNALVVLDDADLDDAAMIGAWSSFHYQGQTCITASRHIVAQSIAEAYQSRLAERARAIVVGDPATDEVGLGCMIDERQRDRGHRFLERSVEQGARVIEGGVYDGLFYRPTVVADVRPGMPLFDEEVFAPVAPITTADSEDEALDLVNATPYGLVNSVLSGDPERGWRFARQVRSGMVHVNDATPLDEAHIPFGGMGASGVGGRSGGEANLEEFTERRWVSVQRAPVHYPY